MCFFFFKFISCQYGKTFINLNTRSSNQCEKIRKMCISFKFISYKYGEIILYLYARSSYRQRILLLSKINWFMKLVYVKRSYISSNVLEKHNPITILFPLPIQIKVNFKFQFQFKNDAKSKKQSNNPCLLSLCSLLFTKWSNPVAIIRNIIKKFF